MCTLGAELIKASPVMQHRRLGLLLTMLGLCTCTLDRSALGGVDASVVDTGLSCATGCEDNNPCTDDSCVAERCVNTAREGDCDDGEFCNGTDTCAAGMCSVHAGGVCLEGQLCDERGEACGECATDADCPAGVVGEWSECEFDKENLCDESGMRVRTLTFYGCVRASCATASREQVEECSRDTEGRSCGSSSVEAGECVYTSTCGQVGLQPVTTTSHECAAGACGSRQEVERTLCNRSTDGVECEDEDRCTFEDTCQVGVCRGMPVVCDDGVECTADMCNPSNGMCLYALQNSFCDDSDPCTTDRTGPSCDCENAEISGCR